MHSLISNLVATVFFIALAMPQGLAYEDRLIQKAARADKRSCTCRQAYTKPCPSAFVPSLNEAMIDSTNTPVIATISSVPASTLSSVGSASTTLSSLVSAQIGKGKRGVMIPADDPNDTPYYVKAFTSETTPRIKWTSNFYSGPPSGLDTNIEYVPQRYNVFAADDTDWEKNAKSALEMGHNIFFSYGEPGLKSANPLAAQTAANDWKQQLQPWTVDGAIVGAPCMGSMDYDFDWLEWFLGNCTECNISFIAIHWINELSAGGAPSSITNFKAVVDKAIGIANGRPVWVDNIRASGAYTDITTFLSAIVPWLESNDNIARYAYFGPGRTEPSSLLNPDGSLSSLGSFYADL